jgi:LysR family transcriptional regulator, cyn operon transcriptional activator
MDLRHLRYFVAVAETGAFARAAARLRITQPALWRQVHSLEAELGVQLFERAGRRVRVTSAGEGLLLRSRELLAGAEQLVEHAQAVRGGDVGRLSIGASPQMIQNVLAPFLALYLKSRPGVDIHLIEEGGARALGLVERGEAHLALAIRRGDDRLDGRLLFPVRVLAAMSGRNPLARRPTLDVTDLQDQRVLLLRHGFGVREMFDITCRIAHVHTHTVLEAGDPQSLMALAEAARGIAIVPSTVELAGRKVRVAPLLHARASVGMWGWIVWDPKRFLPAFARSFIDDFVEYSRRSYPGRQFERRAPPVPRPER